jgi:hypothetical protein
MLRETKRAPCRLLEHAAVHASIFIARSRGRSRLGWAAKCFSGRYPSLEPPRARVVYLITRIREEFRRADMASRVF